MINGKFQDNETCDNFMKGAEYHDDKHKEELHRREHHMEVDGVLTKPPDPLDDVADQVIANNRRKQVALDQLHVHEGRGNLPQIH